MAIYRDTALLHPEFRWIAEGLAEDLIRRYEAGETKTRFELFETFREPSRQLDLLKKGATKAGIFQRRSRCLIGSRYVSKISKRDFVLPAS